MWKLFRNPKNEADFLMLSLGVLTMAEVRSVESPLYSAII